MRAETNHTAIRSLSHETNDELETVDVKLSKIHSLLGKRGRDDGTLSAFGVLQNLEEHVETLRASVQPAVELAEVAEIQAAEQAKETYATMQTQAAEQTKEIYATMQLAAIHYSNCSAKYRAMRVIRAT